jgi:hypothetical protein
MQKSCGISLPVTYHTYSSTRTRKFVAKYLMKQTWNFGIADQDNKHRQSWSDTECSSRPWHGLCTLWWSLPKFFPIFPYIYRLSHWLSGRWWHMNIHMHTHLWNKSSKNLTARSTGIPWSNMPVKSRATMLLIIAQYWVSAGCRQTKLRLRLSLRLRLRLSLRLRIRIRLSLSLRLRVSASAQKDVKRKKLIYWMKQ